MCSRRLSRSRFGSPWRYGTTGESMDRSRERRLRSHRYRLWNSRRGFPPCRYWSVSRRNRRTLPSMIAATSSREKPAFVGDGPPLSVREVSHQITGAAHASVGDDQRLGCDLQHARDCPRGRMRKTDDHPAVLGSEDEGSPHAADPRARGTSARADRGLGSACRRAGPR